MTRIEHDDCKVSLLVIHIGSDREKLWGTLTMLLRLVKRL
jgi:hypothetical protein